MPLVKKAESDPIITVATASRSLSSRRELRNRRNSHKNFKTFDKALEYLKTDTNDIEAPSASLATLPAKTNEAPPKFPVPITLRNLTTMDAPAIDPNAGPPVAPAAPSGPRHDDFYKYWDRFMRVKEKSKAKGSKKPVVKEVAISDIKNGRADSISAGTGSVGRIPGSVPVFKNGKRVGPSLDKDVEGRPGHPMVRSNTEGVISSQRATTSYDEAVQSCKAKVDAIKRECRRLNQKYYDRMFNLPEQDTLLTLDSKEVPHSRRPIVGVGSVKRVEDIYEEPEFFIDGATASDVRQGTNGDCWFLAAITALAGKPELIKKLCVARDEQVGVYGFVFFRG